MKQFIKVLSLFFGIVFVFGLVFYFNAIQVVATPGDPCNTSEECDIDDGEVCEIGPEVDDGECVVDVPEDDDEDLAGIGESCTIRDCEPGLECISGTCDSEDPEHTGTCEDDGDCLSGDECINGQCVDPNATDPDDDSPSGSRSDYGLSNVPDQLRDIGDGDIINVALRVIQYVVGLVGIILLIMFIYGGIMYMTAASNEEQAGKAKKVLTYAVIGIVIVAFSFVITEFIVRALSGDNTNTNTNTNTDSSGRIGGND